MTTPTIRLLETEFEGAGSYRKSSGVLPLANQGKVLIVGPEGVGKTLIAEIPTVILHGRGSPRDKPYTESSLLNGGYLARLLFESNGSEVSITQAHKHPRAGNRYTIAINGVRDQTTLKPEQKKLVKRLAPLSYEEWLGIVYLPAGGSHNLLSGTAAQKQNYLTSVFGLSFYYDLVTTLKDEIKEMERVAVDTKDLTQWLIDTEDAIEKLTEEVDKLPKLQAAVDAYTKAREKTEGISKEIGVFETRKKSYQEYLQAKKDLDHLLGGTPLQDWLDREKVLKARLKELTTLLGELSAQRKALAKEAKAYSLVKTKVTSSKKLLSSLKKDREEIGDPKFPFEAVDAVLTILLKAKTLGVTSIAYESAQDVDWVGPQKDLDSARSSLKKLESLGSKSECPTCQQALSSIHKVVEDLKADVALFEKRVANALAAELHKLLPEVVTKPTTVGAVIPPLVGARQQYEEIAGLDTSIKEARREYKAAKASLEELSEPPSSEVLDEKVQATEAEIEDLTKSLDKISRISKLNHTQENLGRVSQQVDDADLLKLEERMEKAQASLSTALSVKSNVESCYTKLDSLESQKEKVEKKIAAHASTANKLKLLTEEVAPYFTVLRASKVKGCVDVLETVLPMYVGTLAHNQYKGASAKLEVSDDLQQVNLSVKTGKNDPWLSSTCMSWGQTQRFTLALLCAIYEVAPRKANLLWLDEPLFGMETDGKYQVLHRLFPLLQERCPELESIFLTSHDSEVLQSAPTTFDQVWCVDRDAAGSRIDRTKKLSQIVGR